MEDKIFMFNICLTVGPVIDITRPIVPLVNPFCNSKFFLALVKNPYNN